MHRIRRMPATESSFDGIVGAIVRMQATWDRLQVTRLVTTLD